MFATSRPQLECLESRDLPSVDWFSYYLPNPTIANMARADWYNHGAISYNDMLGIYSAVESAGPVSSSEFASLQALVSNGSVLNTPAPTQYLEAQVIGNNASNRYFEGQSLGNLYVGSSPVQLSGLVGKWFLGQDLPAAPGLSYTAVGGNIFGASGPSYTDVAQGGLSDCWLLSSLAVTAYRQPGVIQSMFTYNGNNTVTVRFYENGAPVYVTVNNMLPAGGAAYDHPQNGTLWVALAEKAYAELNTFDPLITTQPGVDSYAVLNDCPAGQFAATLSAITGRAASTSTNQSTLPSQILQGNLAVVGSSPTPSSPYIVPSHVYAVLDYNASTGMYTLFNPWGIQQAASRGVYGVFQAGAGFVATNYIAGAWGGASPDEFAGGAAASIAADLAATTSPAAPAPATPAAHTDAVFAHYAADVVATPRAFAAVVSALHHHAPAADGADLVDPIVA